MGETMSPKEVAGLAENLTWGRDEFARVVGVDSDEILLGIDYRDGRTFEVGIRGGASDEQVDALREAVQQCYDCLRVEHAIWEEELTPKDDESGERRSTSVAGFEFPYTAYDESELVPTTFEGVKAELGGRR